MSGGGDDGGAGVAPEAGGVVLVEEVGEAVAAVLDVVVEELDAVEVGEAQEGVAFPGDEGAAGVPGVEVGESSGEDLCEEVAVAAGGFEEAGVEAGAFLGDAWEVEHVGDEVWRGEDLAVVDDALTGAGVGVRTHWRLRAGDAGCPLLPVRRRGGHAVVTRRRRVSSVRRNRNTRRLGAGCRGVLESPPLIARRMGAVALIGGGIGPSTGGAGPRSPGFLWRLFMMQRAFSWNCSSLIAELAVLLMLLVVDTAWAELPEPRITEPEGAYGLLRLQLDATEGEDHEGFRREVLVAIRGVRGGEPVEAYVTHPGVKALEVAGLTFEGGALRGEIVGWTNLHKEPMSPFRLGLEVERGEGGAWAGRFAWEKTMFEKGEFHQGTGTATGTLHTAGELRAMNDLAEGAEWPSYRGPGANMWAGEQPPLVESLEEARLVWVSECRIPAGPGSSNRGGTVRKIPNGGGASPIVASTPEGHRVFLWFHDANPAVIDKDHLEKRSGGIGEGQKKFVEAAAALADDVVICLDAETGGLVWEARFPNSMANNQEHKQGINNHTPAYANGTVFALTGTMRLIALDARTGELRWEAPAGDVKRYEGFRDEAAKEGRYLGGKYAQRGYGRAPLPLGDMVLVSVGDEVRAFDAATGEVRWTADKATDGDDDLSVWTHGDRTFVVGASPRGITILDPADGSVVYKIDVQADPWDTSPAIVGDLLVTPGHLAGEDKKEVASGYHAFRLGDSGGEHLWSVREGDADLDLGLGGQVTPIIHDGMVYLGGQGGLTMLDANTGRVVQKVAGPG